MNSMKIGNHLLNRLMALNGVKRIRNLTAGSEMEVLKDCCNIVVETRL